MRLRGFRQMITSNLSFIPLTLFIEPLEGQSVMSNLSKFARLAWTITRSRPNNNLAPSSGGSSDSRNANHTTTRYNHLWTFRLSNTILFSLNERLLLIGASFVRHSSYDKNTFIYFKEGRNLYKCLAFKFTYRTRDTISRCYN